MVVTEVVLRGERVAVVQRRLADERVDLRRVDERVDRAVKPLRRELLGLPAPRPEPGAPQKSLGLLRPERSGVHREW